MLRIQLQHNQQVKPLNLHNRQAEDQAMLTMRSGQIQAWLNTGKLIKEAAVLQTHRNDVKELQLTGTL